ncbi:riboflavin kinase [Vararia minispora EC-137]|uniref:Riboflavin kinase n=1 Tax=Vararia minispora EC-137 TaxID=1314806 RepID=A0ACB8QX18_9AGAM|nr:riboflavin kinase [Vararia minispora EC-137]
MDSSVRPAAPLRTETFRRSRPSIVGPDEPEAPFPIVLSGPVQHGFGRGGKDLGCPTANLPDESITPLSSVTEPGVYYGFAQVDSCDPEDNEVYPMVMSLGWNPFYRNERLTAEIHLLHRFKSDFYGRDMKAVVLGYIRPELDYTSREALIEDIQTDIRVAERCLRRPAYQRYSSECQWTP